MNIINALWEKRNFNMDTYEILLDKKDLKFFDETYKKIKEQNFKKAYVLIKIPVGNIEVVHKLEDEGFRFLETQLYLQDHFEPVDAEREMYERNLRTEDIKTVVVDKDKNEWEKIISMITPGMFDNDRVSLDPKLGKDIACLRYQNWCRDLFKKHNTVMYLTKYKEEICGFGINEMDSNTGIVDGIIGGFFEKYKNIGIGVSWIHKSSKLKTAVSSNNLSALKIHQHCGRVIYKERYVLRKIYK